MPKAAKKRKPHVPTAETRRQVERMHGAGLRVEDIAHILDVHPMTITRRYKKEIACGTARMVAEVSNRLYQAALDGCTTSQIFFLKTRGRWSETQKVEHTGADGGPMKVRHVDAPRETMEEYLRRRGGAVIDVDDDTPAH